MIQKLVCFFFFFFFTFLSAEPDHAVTYEFSGGRFGDNLISYLHAKWIAHQHQIKFYYKPFPYSTELILHEKETLYTPEALANRTQKNLENPIHIDLQGSYLYLCPYFPEEELDRHTKNAFYFDIDWENEPWQKIVREMISPAKTLALITPKANTMNIAIHIREGGGYDTTDLCLKDPLKVPPLTFYIECLIHLLNLFPNSPIYCHLFTDARNADWIVETLKNAIPANRQVSFGYRKHGNYHNSNVLEDFFSIFQFDVLIRPQSNFSIVPSLLHDFAAIYSPANYSIQRQEVRITEIKLKINQELCKKIGDRLLCNFF